LHITSPIGAINVSICLQGGGSACAWQAGALIPFVENPYINIQEITGTSGGAFNGAILKHVFARHGQGEKGKLQASKRLRSAWEDDIAQPDHSIMAHNIGSAFLSLSHIFNPNPYSVNIQNEVQRSIFTHRLEETLKKLLHDDSALRSKMGPELFVQTVDEQTRQGRLWTNGEMSRQRVLGSAALLDCFHSVDGQIDGAYLGGANPPAPFKKGHVILYFMTSARPDNVVPKRQSQLTAQDLDKDQLILDQAYCEIELLKKQGYHVEVVAPAISFSKSAKGKTGLSEIKRRIENGSHTGEDRLEDVLHTYAPRKVVA
jgi:hypothetical protein